MKKIIAILIVSPLILGACGEKAEENSNEINSNNQSEIEEIEESEEVEEEDAPIKEIITEEEDVIEESLTYSIGEEAIVYDTDTDKNIFGFKLIKVSNDLTVESDSVYTEGKPENTIELTYEYSNYSLDEAYIVSSQFVNAYDQNGKAGSNMGLQDGQTEVTAGRTAKSTVWIVMDEAIKKGDLVEVDYGGDFVYGFEDYITYIVEVK